MSKTKKALKKSGVSPSSRTAPQLAKKAPSSKSKTVAAKAPVKPTVKKVVKTAVAKAAPKPAPKAPPPKTITRTAASKAAAAPVKATVKAPAKAAAPTPAPKGKVAAPASTPTKVSAKAAAPAPAKTPVKPAAPVKAAKEEKVEAPVDAAKPAAAAKGKKGRAEEVPAEPEEEIILLDAEGRRYCRVRECDQASAVDGYCRYHYLLYWKNIQVRKTILSEGKLERYIEDLTARYPDKYLEMLKKDLRTEKDFLAAIQELEIDESSVDNEYEDEAQNYLDEVRGMSSESGSSDRDEEF